MPITSIAFRPVCCPFENEEETVCSHYSRITSICLGTIIILAGVFALFKIPFLQALGTAGGGTCIGVGGLIVLVPLCIRSIYQLNERDARRTNGLNFKEFMDSTDPDDSAIHQRVKQELQIDDLSVRIRENGFTMKELDCLLNLPQQFDKGIRQDELLFQATRLMYMSKDEILNLPLEEMKGFNDEQRSILSLRLRKIEKPALGNAGTLGALLNYQKDALLSTDTRLYHFFSLVQIVIFLQNTPHLNAEIVDLLFPYKDDLSFHESDLHTLRLLQHMPLTEANRILPFVNGKRLLLTFLEYRGKDLTTSLITDPQLDDMLQSRMFIPLFMETNGKKITLPVLNRCLRKLDDEQLRQLTFQFDSVENLDLSVLPSEKLQIVFPTDNSISRDWTSSKLKHVKIDVLNLIIPKFIGSILKCIPTEFLQNPALDLTPLTEKLVAEMFPADDFFTRNRLTNLHQTVLAQIKLKMNEKQLKLIPGR